MNPEGITAALAAVAVLVGLLAASGSLVCPPRPARSTLIEGLFLRIVLGAALLPIVWIALYEVLRVPFHPMTALALGLAGLARLVRDERRRAPSPSPSATARAHSLALLGLALGTFWAVFKGATLFTSFEGRDAWGHALGARYLWDVGIPRQPFPDRPVLHYVDAYPPLLDALLSLICQLAGSVNAPLKATSATVAALACPALYALVHGLTGDRRRAALAAGLYAMLPGNLTRHVWGHSLALVFVLFGLATLPGRRGPANLAPSALCFAGALLAAPTTGMKGGLLLALTAAVLLRIDRRWAGRVAASGLVALVLSAVWFAPALARYGLGIKRAMEQPRSRWALESRGAVETAPGPDGRERSASSGQQAPGARRYNLDDFLFFRPYDLGPLWTGPKFTESIAPIGLGVPVTALAAVSLSRSLLRRRRNRPAGRRLLHAWLVAALLGALSPHLGVEFYTWRVWLLLVPLACAAAADGLVSLLRASALSWRTAAALALIAAGSAFNAIMAIAWDFVGGMAAREFWSHGNAPGPLNPWFFLEANRGFLMALLAAGSLGLLSTRAPGMRVRQSARLLAGLVVVGHLLIAAPLRLRTLTGFIQPLGFASTLEYRGYLGLTRDTRPGDRVLPLSGWERSEFVIGLDRDCRPYDREEFVLTRRASSVTEPLSASELLGWLQQRGYRYLVVDPSHQRELAEDDPRGAALFGRRLAELRSASGVEVRLDLSDGYGPGAEEFVLLRIGAPSAQSYLGRGTMSVSKVKPVAGSSATAFPDRSP